MPTFENRIPEIKKIRIAGEKLFPLWRNFLESVRRHFTRSE